MPPENRQDDHDEQEQVAEEQTQEVAAFSPEQLEGMLSAARKEGRDSGFAEARRNLKSKSRRSAPKAEPTEADMWSDGSWRDEFDDAIDDFDGLGKKARRKIRDLVKRTRPDDIASEVSSLVESFGLSGTEQVKPQTQTQPEPTRRPISDRGAPAQQGGLESADPVWRYSKAEVAQIVQKYGVSGAGKILKERGRNQLRKTNWYHGPNRS